MKINGWRKVFAFTLKQYVKTKSFKISTVIICVLVAAMAVLTNILPVILSENNDSGYTYYDDTDITEFSAVYIIDETGLVTDAKIAELVGRGIAAERTELSAEEISAQIAVSEKTAAAVVFASVNGDDGAASYYDISTYCSPEAESAHYLTDIITERFRYWLAESLGIEAGVFDRATLPIVENVREVIENDSVEETNIYTQMFGFIIPLISSIVLFMLIFVYGTIIAQSMALEKTSRVMELLLTSVRPLAVVVGKVLAMGVVCFGQFLLIIAVGAVSIAASAPFGILGRISPILSDSALLSSDIGAASASALAGVSVDEYQLAQAVNELQESLSLTNIVLVVLVFIIGFVFYALVAALFGASVSRSEDLQAAMQPYSLLGVVGFYLAYFPMLTGSADLASSAGASGLQLFSYYFPLSSPFALPSAIILGQLDTAGALIAVLIMAVITVLMALFVSKIYEAVVLHSGSRLKIGDMVKLAKTRR